MLAEAKKLHVITPYSNHLRYRSRKELYLKFKKHMQDSGVNLHTVELQMGARPFEVTEVGNSQDLQLRTFDEMWHKENMINLAIAQLPKDWEYVAWIDADVFFTRPDWALETVHQLQHFMVVQLFSKAQDLGPDYQPLEMQNGFAWSYIQNQCQPPQGSGTGGYYGYEYGTRGFWHPGYAWAARREAIDAVGGLVDYAILGAADHHMALGLIGCMGKSMPKGISPQYRNQLLQWEARAEKTLKRDLGYVDGLINHHWHGPKTKRYYVERWGILTKNQYDPEVDLRRDWQGLYLMSEDTPRQRRLRDEIRRYFRARDEDSNHVG